MELIAEAPKLRASRDRCDPVVELVVPIYNEQATLEASIRRVHAFAAGELWMPWRITIADNASTDSSPEIARRLARELTAVSYLRLARCYNLILRAALRARSATPSAASRRSAPTWPRNSCRWSPITAWVEAHYKSITIGGQTVYVLTNS